MVASLRAKKKMEQTTHVCFLSFCVDPCYNPHVEPCVAAYPHFFHAFSRQIRFFWKSVEAVSAFCAPLATRCLRRKKETKKTCLLSATLAAWMNNWLSSGGRLAEAGTADFVCGISFWMVEEKPFRAVVFFFSNVRNPKWPRIFLLSFKVFEMPLPVLRLSETALSRRSADWNAARLVTLMQFCIFFARFWKRRKRFRVENSNFCIFSHFLVRAASVCSSSHWYEYFLSMTELVNDIMYHATKWNECPEPTLLRYSTQLKLPLQQAIICNSLGAGSHE